MGDMTRREAVKELEAIVRETDYFGWYQSASLFIELDAIESLETLLRLKGTPIAHPSNYWKDDTSPPDALRDLGFAARCSEIAWFLQSTDPSVVIGALRALGEFEAPEYAPEITALLSRGEPENVRTAALWTLATLRVKPPVEVLADLLDPAEPLALRCDALFLLDKRDAQPDPATR